MNYAAIHLSGSKSGRKRSGEKKKSRSPVETYSFGDACLSCKCRCQRGSWMYKSHSHRRLRAWISMNTQKEFNAIILHVTSRGNRWRMSKIEPWMTRRRRKNKQAEKEKKMENQENVSLKHFKKKIYLTFQSSSFLVCQAK